MDYRNKLAAHLDLRAPRPSHFPSYDKALSAAYHYYEWLLIHSEDDQLDHLPRSLERYADRFLGQASEMARVAMTATNLLDDEVG